MKPKRSIKNTKLAEGLAKIPKLPAAGRAKLPKHLSDIRRPAIATSVKESVKKHLPTSSATQPGPLESLTDLPKITNETVAEHREAVLSSARKYIYPLQHSRGVIIKVSVSLFIAAIVAFFVYCGLALYKFQSTSSFIYEVTRVIPFPVAKAGPHFVSYESYLFELRHLKHYYETQQKENFADPKWAEHYTRLKQDSLQKVINDAYVKQLADENKVTVSNREVEDQIALMKSQNRLGSNDQMLEDVLDQFWDWSIDDFERELKTQLLSQKVASTMDTATHARADNALAEVKGGADFGAVATKYSDDAESKARAGQYAAPIGKTDRNVPPQVVDSLFSLTPGQVSEVVEAGYTLEILKHLGLAGDKINAAHITFKLQPITVYIAPVKEDDTIHRFISV